MKKKKKLDKFHYHEALDRASIVVDIFDDHVLQHPVVQKHKKLKKKATKLVYAMADFYQLLGSYQPYLRKE